MSGLDCYEARSVFFICQPHFCENVMDRLIRARKTETRTNFLQSQIGLLRKKRTQLTAISVDNDGPASLR
jgi:hypothetical protein